MNRGRGRVGSQKAVNGRTGRYGIGRGRHMTVPAWMMKKEEFENSENEDRSNTRDIETTSTLNRCTDIGCKFHPSVLKEETKADDDEDNNWKGKPFFQTQSWKDFAVALPGSIWGATYENAGFDSQPYSNSSPTLESSLHIKNETSTTVKISTEEATKATNKSFDSSSKEKSISERKVIRDETIDLKDDSCEEGKIIDKRNKNDSHKRKLKFESDENKKITRLDTSSTTEKNLKK